ncbi:MAG: DUF1573 domain-containing protein [Bacteroidales bacterium]
MKRIAIILLTLVTSLILNAQQTSPEVTFDKETHDFGLINEQDGAVSFSFKLTNTGDAPLIINRISTTCGCTASEWQKEPIAPGKSTIIKATYNPKGRPGRFNQRLTVFSNAASSGTVLTLRGQVRPRPRTKEDVYRRRIGELGITNSHASFGKVFVNETKIDTLKVYNFSEETLNLTFERVPNYIEVAVKPNSLKPEQEGLIIVTFDANKIDDWGFVINRIRLKINNENPRGNLINVTANLEEDFSQLTEKEKANAPKIEFEKINKDFGTVEEGKEINHEFVFKNTGKSDLVIRKIRASCGCTTAAPKSSVIKPGKKSSLSASFKTRGFTGRQTKTISVISNDPEHPTMVLRLSGTVTKGK